MSFIGSCSICTEAIVHNPAALPCGHTYHYECVLIWISNSSLSCPKCRRPVIKEHIIKLFVDPVEESEQEKEEDELSTIQSNAPPETSQPSPIPTITQTPAAQTTTTTATSHGASPFSPSMFASRPAPPLPQPPFAFVRISRPTAVLNLRPRPFVCMHSPRATVTLRSVQNHVHHAPTCLAASVRPVVQPPRIHSPSCLSLGARTPRPVTVTQNRMIFTPIVRVIRHVNCNASPNGRRVQVQAQTHPDSGSNNHMSNSKT